MRHLTCDMTKDCPERVTHIGEKGYVYCATHAPQRRGWERTRRLHALEIAQLEAGYPLASFTPKRDPIGAILKRTYYNA